MNTVYHNFDLPYLRGFKYEYYFEQTKKPVLPERYPAHLHTSIEVYILLEGSVSFAVGSKVHSLKSGDIIVAKPNEVHNCIRNEKCIHDHICMWLEPTDEFLFGKILKSQNSYISPKGECKSRLLSICNELMSASTQENKLRLYSTVISLIQLIDEKIDDNSDESKHPIPPMLQKILDDINDNFASILSLGYFTDKYYISQSTLSRLFKRYLNTSPRQYLETKRLSVACSLLKEGLSVGEVCQRIGLSNSSNFARLFKKKFGITPSNYIK